MYHLLIADDLKYVLPNYLKMAFKGKVVLIKSQANVGLIKARNLGFRVARGQVVAVMDSHMEPRPHWYIHLDGYILNNQLIRRHYNNYTQIHTWNYVCLNHCCDVTLLFKVLILFKESNVSLVH